VWSAAILWQCRVAAALHLRRPRDCGTSPLRDRTAGLPLLPAAWKLRRVQPLAAPGSAGWWHVPLRSWPWPGLLHAAGTVYSLIHEGENGGPVRGGRGGRGGSRRQLRAAAGPTASGSNLDGAGSCHVPSRGFGATCRASGHGRACSPLPPSLTCPGGQGPDPGGVAGARARLGT